jgi:acyl-phosphate glycerol 3-phosphate acyltransferase
VNASFLILSILSALSAYLIGAIPFGYLIARWARGIDIRTVGSGNIGATNVGRVLGFRFFAVVFTLDLLKGLLPTLGLPRAVRAATGQGQGGVALAVLVALAAILGHNFPVYLRFRGGKGVATSLGALLALDTTAALASAAGFGLALMVTGYVSASSLLGGVVFAVVHFARSHAPWSRDQIAMSLLTVGLLVLLFVRHRKNLSRIRAGTEPRVSFRKKTKKPPEGRISRVLLIFIALTSGIAGLVLQASRRPKLSLGRCTLAEVARVQTGHQRAERVVFADRERLLAVTCPRYDRVVYYRVTRGDSLEVQRDIKLNGHPVAIQTVEDRLFVLQRPPGDARHLEPGFWETFDFQGRRIGSRYRVGFYPDDLAITPDGRQAIVLTSGRAEGDAHRPAPALAVIALGGDASAHRVVGRIEFDRPGDDPERLALSDSGRWATVALRGSDQSATIDLSDPSSPAIVARTSRGPDRKAAPRDVQGDTFANPLEWEGGSVRLDLPELGDCLARAQPEVSGLELIGAATRRSMGLLPIRGAMNLSPTRPTGVALAPGRGLIAVTTRSGGVHLIAINPVPDPRIVAGTESPESLRR